MQTGADGGARSLISTFYVALILRIFAKGQNAKNDGGSSILVPTKYPWTEKDCRIADKRSLVSRIQWDQGDKEEGHGKVMEAELIRSGGRN